MKNRFNRLTSKEWLPFQKSWFRYQDTEQLYRENFRFFCRAEVTDEVLLYDGKDKKTAEKIALENQLKLSSWEELAEQEIQFAVIDWRYKITSATSLDDYKSLKGDLVDRLKQHFDYFAHRRFLAVFLPNVISKEGQYLPFAWDLAKEVASLFSLKDEKIAGIKQEVGAQKHYISSETDVFYALYWRKDENSPAAHQATNERLLTNSRDIKTIKFPAQLPAWFILKPQPRKKQEVLHPAKYPEDLVTMCLEVFSKAGDVVFDPMSGTGSTQVAALRMGRHAYGTELSEFFAPIAQERCAQAQQSSQYNSLQHEIFQADAREIRQLNIPAIDYIITSPPYWDMLNMKGAENQAKRIEKGLQTNYSDNEEDLGNINDYYEFLEELAAIYFSLYEQMKAGAFMTIVVKNIKKKGRNYPFAWDLSQKLKEKFILWPEVFWCQDDINIAPYGYGNTFVSNTFHQYCLNFQKPPID